MSISVQRPWPIGTYLALWSGFDGGVKIHIYVVTRHHNVIDADTRESIEPLQFDPIDVTKEHDEISCCPTCGHTPRATDDRLHPIEPDSLLLRLGRDRETVLREDPAALTKAVELMKELTKAS